MIKGQITFDGKEDAIMFINSLIETFDIKIEELD